MKKLKIKMKNLKGKMKKQTKKYIDRKYIMKARMPISQKKLLINLINIWILVLKGDYLIIKFIIYYHHRKYQ